ncbi:hypothetical protein SO802_032112 [Lithocarpus litseifolius]|uniref:Uncharacterized protein n=1 Tax=Lithocarpus litseifolius TaxID=425828 RepID=A0AAW2BPA9_9ROSI
MAESLWASARPTPPPPPPPSMMLLGLVFSSFKLKRTRTRTLELLLYDLSHLLFSGTMELKTLLDFAAHPIIF